jgi:hypothetical protein
MDGKIFEKFANFVDVFRYNVSKTTKLVVLNLYFDFRLNDLTVQLLDSGIWHLMRS